MIHRRKGMDALAIAYIHAVHQVQTSVVTTFELTIAAQGFKINLCAARGVKKVGQH